MHYSTNDPLVSVLDEFQPEAGLGGKVGGWGGWAADGGGFMHVSPGLVKEAQNSR